MLSSLSLVDPETLGVIEKLGAMEIGLDTLADVRAGSAAFLIETPELSGGVLRTERFVAGPAGAEDVRVVIYTPTAGRAAARPALLHLHAGGFMIGQPEFADPRNRSLAAELDMVVVSVDYRLAPENPHPAPIEDCHAALVWLYDHAAELGVDPARIAIGGESAGGGLAAALALLARDRGSVPVAIQMLIYPMLDDRTGNGVVPGPLTGEFVWPAPSNAFGWQSLLAGAAGGPDTSPYAAAARAQDLSGLPPAFIVAAPLDVLCDENIAYANRLIRAGVPTELHVYPGTFHGFDAAPDAQVSRNFERDYRAALRKALG